MKVIPYLNFDGRCAEAFRFYERGLKGRLESLLTHADSPMAGHVGPEWQDRVLHACLIVGDYMIMGSDTPPGVHAKPQGMYVNLTLDDPAEAERIFGELVAGGEETMAMGPTFWATRFGICADRFGTRWMVNCPVPAEQGAAPAGR